MDLASWSMVLSTVEAERTTDAAGSLKYCTAM